MTKDSTSLPELSLAQKFEKAAERNFEESDDSSSQNHSPHNQENAEDKAKMLHLQAITAAMYLAMTTDRTFTTQGGAVPNKKVLLIFDIIHNFIEPKCLTTADDLEKANLGILNSIKKFANGDKDFVKNYFSDQGVVIDQNKLDAHCEHVMTTSRNFIVSSMKWMVEKSSIDPTSYFAEINSSKTKQENRPEAISIFDKIRLNSIFSKEFNELQTSREPQPAAASTTGVHNTSSLEEKPLTGIKNPEAAVVISKMSKQSSQG